MCQRLEPFKHGGFLLFTDLSAKDSTYILPLTLSAVMLLSVEINALEGMEGNPYATNMKKIFRIFALVLFPISLSFETALFFYWIPSNFFSIFQSYMLRQKAVKAFVGIPSTEHLATSSTNVTPAEPALPNTRTINPVKKKLALGRGKSKGHGRR
ncbi:hypothetical protein L7F22_001408 [Adiantum nelumboides]|nr:hypothetical protein [Adiantum nelumboides]